MLLEMAIGDAYGAAFEFIKPPYTNLVNDCRTYQRHPELSIGNGRYTDDTQMALAVAEAIFNDRITKFDFAESFVECFKRDERPGYGKRTLAALQTANDGSGLLAIQDGQSSRSGGAMRAAPCGLYPDLSMVLMTAESQASVTHNSPGGLAAAKAVALMAHYAAFKVGQRADMGKFLYRLVPYAPWMDDWTGWVTVDGVECVRAVSTVVRNATSLTDVLRRSVDMTGDVDTIAAISMFIGSLCEDLPNDLSPSLYEGLENGPYGRDYLIAMDQRLDEFRR